MKALLITRLMLMIILLSTEAVKIFPNNTTTLFRAVGSRTTFECHFTLDEMDHGLFEIEWRIKVHDLHREDPTILLYTLSKIYSDLYFPLTDRVYVRSSDPSQGDASIVIEGLKWSDEGNYLCQVKKVPGIARRQHHLHLMAAPSLPSSVVEFTSYIGSDVIIKCHSNGTRPILYSWDRIDGQQMPVSASVDHFGGTLHFISAKETDGGRYRCTAHNLVGNHMCILTLHFTHAMKTVVQLAVGGSLALVLLAGLLFYCCRKRKTDTEHGGTVILMDALPPKRKAVTFKIDKNDENQIYCSMKDIR